MGIASPSSTLIVERLDIDLIEPQTRLLTDLQLHLFLNDGSVNFYGGTEGASMPVRRGQVGICPRNQWHSISFRQPTSMLSVHIDDSIISEVSLEIAKGRQLDPSLPPIMEDLRLTHLLFALAEEQAHGYPTGELIVDALELAIVKLLVSRQPPHSTSSAIRYKLGPARLKRVLEFMQANLGRKVTLRQLAECVGLSTNFFSEQFRAETGLAPHRYMTKSRIDLAKQMLSKTRDSVLEVAMAVGFENQQHFATVFRRSVGVAPSVYRHMMNGRKYSENKSQRSQHFEKVQ